MIKVLKEQMTVISDKKLSYFSYSYFINFLFPANKMFENNLFIINNILMLFTAAALLSKIFELDNQKS